MKTLIDDYQLGERLPREREGSLALFVAVMKISSPFVARQSDACFCEPKFQMSGITTIWACGSKLVVLVFASKADMRR